jgi:cell division protein FtsB
MAKRTQSMPPDVVEMPAFNDRRIYSDGVAMPSASPDAPPAVVRANVRKSSRRRVKTTNVVGAMILFAAAALLYVGNVIAVNNLAKEVNDLHNRYRQITAMNELLKAEINRKTSLDRISLLAQDQLEMTNPKEAPVWFEVDRAKEEALLEER